MRAPGGRGARDAWRAGLYRAPRTAPWFGAGRPGLRIRRRVDSPSPGHAFELVVATIVKHDAGAGDEVLHGLGHENLPAIRKRCNPRARVNSDPSDLATKEFALARVHAPAHFETDGARVRRNSERTADRARRAVESREEAVPGSVNLCSAPTRQLAPHRRLMLSKQVAPAAVAEPRGALGRADDVGEEDRRQYAIGVPDRAHAGEELLALLEHRILVTDPREMIRAGELDELRTGNATGDPATFLDLRLEIISAVEDKGRHVDGRQHSANVDCGVHPQERRRSCWTRATSKV